MIGVSLGPRSPYLSFSWVVARSPVGDDFARCKTPKTFW